MNELENNVTVDQMQEQEAQEQVKQAEPQESEAQDSEKKEPEEQTKEQPKAEQPDINDLLVKIASLERKLDKANGEAADWKRKFRSTQSEKEIMDSEAAERAAEHEEEFNAMKRQLQIHDLTENFMDMGYPKEIAKKAAAAQADGDTETLFAIQRQVQEDMLKAKEKEWIASRPEVNSGNGTQEEEDPFLKGFNSVKQQI